MPTEIQIVRKTEYKCKWTNVSCPGTIRGGKIEYGRVESFYDRNMFDWSYTRIQGQFHGICDFCHRVLTYPLR